jgi:hypothetical protein
MKIKTGTEMKVKIKIHQTKLKTTQPTNPSAKEIQNIIIYNLTYHNQLPLVPSVAKELSPANKIAENRGRM